MNMGNNENAIEAEIQTKGLTAPRVTPADIDAAIAQEFYFTAANGMENHPEVLMNGVDVKQVYPQLALLTFCVLVLRNGFTVTGESACASPENFDAHLGRKIAKAKARDKIWALEGYLLRQRLSGMSVQPATSGCGGGGSSRSIDSQIVAVEFGQ